MAPQASAVAANLLACGRSSGRAGHDDHRADGRGRERRRVVPALPVATRTRAGGALDATAAIESLANAVPPRDAHEPNDDRGKGAYRLYFPVGEKARL